MAGKKQKQGGGKKTVKAAFPWRRLALASIVANVALLFVLLWERPGAGLASESTSASGKDRVTDFIDVYFGTWSAEDMDGYKRCFHPGATVSFVTQEGVVQGPMALDPFIEAQGRVFTLSEEPMREAPMESVIDIDGPVARALVRWKLTKGKEVETGVDYFTLLDTRDGWKIVNLVFRKDE